MTVIFVCMVVLHFHYKHYTITTEIKSS